MAREKKIYARYYIVRQQQSLWKGDPADEGSEFRNLVITSNEFNWTAGTFQVYALQGKTMGIKNGDIVNSNEEPTVIFDKDFQGLAAAEKEFSQIIKDSEGKGYRQMTFIEQMEFEAKLKGMH